MRGLTPAQAAGRPRVGRQNQRTTATTPARRRLPHQNCSRGATTAIEAAATKQAAAIVPTSQRLRVSVVGLIG